MTVDQFPCLSFITSVSERRDILAFAINKLFYCIVLDIEKGTIVLLCILISHNDSMLGGNSGY